MSALNLVKAAPMTPTRPTRPIWLLDVDGVLNAYNYRGSGPTDWETYLSASADGYTITWAPELIARINRIHNSGLVEIHWATMWESRANTYISPLLGLPQFPVEHGSYYPAHRDWWKQGAAENVEPDVPLIWTDDDIDPYRTGFLGYADWMADLDPALLADTPVQPILTGLDEDAWLSGLDEDGYAWTHNPGPALPNKKVRGQDLTDLFCATRPNLLAIAPDGNMGLTPADLDAIEAFLLLHTGVDVTELELPPIIDAMWVTGQNPLDYECEQCGSTTGFPSTDPVTGQPSTVSRHVRCEQCGQLYLKPERRPDPGTKKDVLRHMLIEHPDIIGRNDLYGTVKTAKAARGIHESSHRRHLQDHYHPEPRIVEPRQA